MSQAKTGDTVRIHYTGKLDNGQQFDSSSGRDPLEFVLGDGQVIPGFEQAVIGMTVGDNKTVAIQPEDAYGERYDQLVQKVARNELPDDMELQEGMQLQAQSPDGHTTRFVITAIDAESITVDGNHPLAGQILNFDIELVEIG